MIVTYGPSERAKLHPFDLVCTGFDDAFVRQLHVKFQRLITFHAGWACGLVWHWALIDGQGYFQAHERSEKIAHLLDATEEQVLAAYAVAVLEAQDPSWVCQIFVGELAAIMGCCDAAQR